jgi:hypothetical protein
MNRLFTVLTLSLSLVLSAGAMSFSEPLLITSAGQSNDLLIARQIFIRAGLENPVLDADVSPDSLSGTQSLVLVVGGSAKGLGQAQDAADLELTRIDALLASAEEQEMQVLCLHLGREARRGPLSDRFITPVLERSHRMVVLAGGNEDSLFTKAAEAFSIPLVEVHDYVGAVEEVNRLFGWKRP